MDTLVVAPTADHPALAHLRRLVCALPCFGTTQAVTPDQLPALSPPLPAQALVLVGADGSALEAVRHLREMGVKKVLAVGPAVDPKFLLRVMQAGADLFLDEAELEADLNSAVARLRLSQPNDARRRQVVAVLSAAGGCGASTLAANLGAAFARAHGGCHLIDLNAGQPDLAPLFDLKPQYTLADLCRNDGRLDASLYQKLLTPHACGVSLLAAPSEADGSVTPRGVARAVALGAEAFAEVVIDVKDTTGEEQWAALEQATRVLVVTRLSFTAVRNARRALDRLTARGIARDRVEVVVNHSGLPTEVLTADAAAALGVPLTLFVPHDPEAMNTANNTGVPVVLGQPTSAVAAAVRRVAGVALPPTAGRMARFGQVAADVCGKVGSGVRALVRRFATTPPANPAAPLTPATPPRYALDS